MVRQGSNEAGSFILAAAARKASINGRFDSRRGQSYTHRSPVRKDHAYHPFRKRYTLLLGGKGRR
jgi:hypothetical protein